MRATAVDVTTIAIDESTSQQNTTADGSLALFRGLKVNPVTTLADPSSSVKKANTYDFLITSTADAAEGTVTSNSPVANTFADGTITCASVLAADTVTINGLVYTAVSGTKADNTEFTIDGGDNAVATDLADSITNDSRTGTLGDLTAIAATNVVTATTDVLGAAGNAVTLVSSNGTRLAVSGAGTLTGGVTADTITINGLVYTAVAGAKADNTEFSIDGDDTATATDIAASVTADTRTGTIGDVFAESAAAVVTLIQTLGGTAGNATTLASSDGTRLAVSGATFSGGTDGPVTANIATRGVTVAASVGTTPVEVTGFFTSLTNDSTAEFFAFPKVNKNGKIDYDLIYTAVGAGSVTLDLNIVTVEVPVGATAPVFPVLPNATDPVQVAAVLRNDNGSVRTYDYFMLSEQ